MVKRVGGTDAAARLKQVQKLAEKSPQTEAAAFKAKVENVAEDVADVGSDIVLAAIGTHVAHQSIEGLRDFYTSPNYESGSFSGTEYNLLFGATIGSGMAIGSSLKLVNRLAVAMAKEEE